MKCLFILEYRLICVYYNLFKRVNVNFVTLKSLINDIRVYHVSRADNRIAHRGDSCAAESHNRSPPRNHGA